MHELDILTEPLDTAMSITRHLESVTTYPELRNAYNAVQPKASEFYAGIHLDEGLWNAVRAFGETEEARTSRECGAGLSKRQ